MALSFAVILTVATFFTGILWGLEKFKWAPERQKKVEMVRQQTDGKIDGNILAEVGKPKAWIDSLSSLFPVLLVVFIIRSFIFEPFQIPSGSMMPTLLVGDFILVEKYAYGIKDPITNTTLIETGKPARGDVAVFKYPRDPRIDFVKRIVGLPGDTVSYNSQTKELTIYPACQSEGCQGQVSEPLSLQYSTVSESDWMQVFDNTGSNFYTNEEYKKIKLNSSMLPFELKTRQELLGDEPHNILMLPMVVYRPSDLFKQDGQPQAQWIIPEGHYFAMGDNRDNSDDSRFWGFVPEKYLVGRASTIWMSFDKQPNEWPTGVRVSRIGAIN